MNSFFRFGSEGGKKEQKKNKQDVFEADRRISEVNKHREDEDWLLNRIDQLQKTKPSELNGYDLLEIKLIKDIFSANLENKKNNK